MIVFIIEVDRDYNTVSDTFKMEFISIQEAEQWCKDSSWYGHLYFVDKSMTKVLNS